MKLIIPYSNDSDIGYIDPDFLDEEEKENQSNEDKQVQPVS